MLSYRGLLQPCRRTGHDLKKCKRTYIVSAGRHSTGDVNTRVSRAIESVHVGVIHVVVAGRHGNTVPIACICPLPRIGTSHLQVEALTLTLEAVDTGQRINHAISQAHVPFRQHGLGSDLLSCATSASRFGTRGNGSNFDGGFEARRLEMPCS